MASYIGFADQKQPNTILNTKNSHKTKHPRAAKGAKCYKVAKNVIGKHIDVRDFGNDDANEDDADEDEEDDEDEKRS